MFSHAQITEIDGVLYARLLHDSTAPEGVVLQTHIPLGDRLFTISFCGMTTSRAHFLSMEGLTATLSAIASATIGVAHTGERWYALEIMDIHRTDMEKVVKKLGHHLNYYGIGWLNPMVLAGPNGGYLLDLALSDETNGRLVISDILRHYKKARWIMMVKPDGLNISTDGN